MGETEAAPHTTKRAMTAPIRLSADNPGPYTGDGNNTWLLDGAEPTLIDAGTGVPSHLAALERALDGRPLARVLVTHNHSDHAKGVPALRERWPGLEVFKFCVDGEEGAWLPLRDGQRLRAGDASLVAIHTPGHAVDHLLFWDAAHRAAYTGDLVIRPGSVLIPAGRGGHLRDYLRSLERLSALSPRVLYPGHGPIIENPAAVIAEYVSHRHTREAQILACLAEGLTDVEGLVSRLYPLVPEGLLNAARMTVQAHLDKIREDRAEAASASQIFHGSDPAHRV